MNLDILSVKIHVGHVSSLNVPEIVFEDGVGDGDLMSHQNFIRLCCYCAFLKGFGLLLLQENFTFIPKDIFEDSDVISVIQLLFILLTVSTTALYFVLNEYGNIDIDNFDISV